MVTADELLLNVRCLCAHMLQDLLDITECVIRQPGYEFLSMTTPHFHITLRQL